ncbi:hypothetical protein THAOC_17321 [Thalassiosira oceanica]|uniref:Uncharacterized protein n=1 Tax=Thalassiosira oceanica TaxID=159749 RepID=K0SUY0_THAOC|nr:hypothetical protein THAOC_17321 [Thalassiosira oceanica]|eukprot:EJK62082.1 hypothetical protein THAOC_17321 [Thalassiosira oceanica]
MHGTARRPLASSLLLLGVLLLGPGLKPDEDGILLGDLEVLFGFLVLPPVDRVDPKSGIARAPLDLVLNLGGLDHVVLGPDRLLCAGVALRCLAGEAVLDCIVDHVRDPDRRGGHALGHVHFLLVLDLKEAHGLPPLRRNVALARLVEARHDGALNPGVAAIIYEACLLALNDTQDARFLLAILTEPGNDVSEHVLLVLSSQAPAEEGKVLEVVVGDGSLATGQTREVATGVLPDQVLFLSGLAGGSSQPGALLTEVVVIAIDEGLRQHCTRLEAEVTARNRGDLQGAYREEDVASDRAVEALVDDEARIGFAQDVEEHARPLGRLGGVQPGVDELRVDVRSGLGEEHVAPRAEHDEEANEVVPVEVELEEVDPLVVPEHEPVVLSPEEGDVLVTREIRDEPELSIARAVPPRDAVLVAPSDSAVSLDFLNIILALVSSLLDWNPGGGFLLIDGPGVQAVGSVIIIDGPGVHGNCTIDLLLGESGRLPGVPTLELFQHGSEVIADRTVVVKEQAHAVVVEELVEALQGVDLHPLPAQPLRHASLERVHDDAEEDPVHVDAAAEHVALVFALVARIDEGLGVEGQTVPVVVDGLADGRREIVEGQAVESVEEEAHDIDLALGQQAVDWPTLRPPCLAVLAVDRGIPAVLAVDLVDLDPVSGRADLSLPMAVDERPRSVHAESAAVWVRERKGRGRRVDHLVPIVEALDTIAADAPGLVERGLLVLVEVPHAEGSESPGTSAILFSGGGVVPPDLLRVLLGRGAVLPGVVLSLAAIGRGWLPPALALVEQGRERGLVLVAVGVAPVMTRLLRGRLPVAVVGVLARVMSRLPRNAFIFLFLVAQRADKGRAVSKLGLCRYWEFNNI